MRMREVRANGAPGAIGYGRDDLEVSGLSLWGGRSGMSDESLTR